MNPSNRVDLVIAEAGTEQVAAAHRDESASVEAVDVAPDPKRRIIVLAATKQAGHEYAEALGIEPVAIVTPRSPAASVGLIADEIVEAPDLTSEVVAELMVNATPSLATGGVD